MMLAQGVDGKDMLISRSLTLITSYNVSIDQLDQTPKLFDDNLSNLCFRPNVDDSFFI